MRQNKKKIFAFCKKCKRRISIPLPADFEVKAPDGLYVVVHVHGEDIDDAHSLIIEVDRNNNVRNTRASDQVIFSFDF
ncbi:MAG: hypothetical protein Kow0069_34580 [Promethearchaeota archaeon]